MLNFKFIVSKLKKEIEGLTLDQRIKFYSKMSPEVLNQYFQQIKEDIKLEAERRLKDKIKTTFNKGYSKGRLANSVYAKFENNKIIVNADQPYFHFLNRGIKSFDMKKALMGRKLALKLPNGSLIFRTVAPNTGKNWIHPGLPATNVSDIVQNEMDLWMQTYVSEKINFLINMAKD